jgi:hypothetical protein
MFIADIKRELKEAEEWDNAEGGIDRIDLIDLSKKGIDTCTGFCASREYCGEDRCYCIRARFESPQTYQLYKHCREYFINNLAIAVIAEEGLIDQKEKEDGKGNNS